MIDENEKLIQEFAEGTGPFAEDDEEDESNELSAAEDVVDDDEAVDEMLRLIGYPVVQAGNGKGEK